MNDHASEAKVMVSKGNRETQGSWNVANHFELWESVGSNAQSVELAPQSIFRAPSTGFHPAAVSFYSLHGPVSLL